MDATYQEYISDDMEATRKLLQEMLEEKRTLWEKAKSVYNHHLTTLSDTESVLVIMTKDGTPYEDKVHNIDPRVSIEYKGQARKSKYDAILTDQSIPKVFFWQSTKTKFIRVGLGGTWIRQTYVPIGEVEASRLLIARNNCTPRFMLSIKPATYIQRTNLSALETKLVEDAKLCSEQYLKLGTLLRHGFLPCNINEIEGGIMMCKRII